jgi:hypothetical protein
MLSNLISLTTAFRFINFGAFIGLVIYGYKRYLLPSLLKQIHEKKLLLQNLENQKQGIKYQLSNLDQALEQQHHLAQELTKKIGIWSENVHIQQQQEAEESRVNRDALLKLSELKNKKIAFDRTTKKVVPRVIKDLEHDLTQHFEHQAPAQKYIDDIIGFIKESTP